MEKLLDHADMGTITTLKVHHFSNSMDQLYPSKLNCESGTTLLSWKSTSDLIYGCVRTGEDCKLDIIRIRCDKHSEVRLCVCASCLCEMRKERVSSSLKWNNETGA